MTATSMPSTASPFRSAPVPLVESRETVVGMEVCAAQTDAEGYIIFSVAATTFAVAVTEVREVIRAVRLELLPGATTYGRRLGLVDVRGRTIPVVDLRVDIDESGDVLLPVYRRNIGLVVDRVPSVQTRQDLVPEHDDVPNVLPSYARAVLRPSRGGAPVLLIAMPDALEIEADAARDDEQRLGRHIIDSLPR